jgi:predicted O-linked N-acetylglucosamine transferase (SPINDLY family)
LIDAALKTRPDSAEALSHYGIVLRNLGRWDEALARYDQALTVNPNYAEAWNNRGVVLRELRRYDEAVVSYETALGIKPDYLDAWDNRGAMMLAQSKYAEALLSFDKVLAIKPNYAEAWYNRGNALLQGQRHEEAIDSYGQALAIKPEYPEALSNRGNALSALKRYAEALTSYDRARAIKPDDAYAFAGSAAAARAICDWDRTGEIAAEMASCITEGRSSIPPLILIDYYDDPELQMECAKACTKRMVPTMPKPLCNGTVVRHDKIRLAYLSPDFRRHPVSYLIPDLIELHDRSSFEIIGVSYGRDDRSEIRARLIAAFDRFYDMQSKSDRELAEFLRGLEVDIAIDLAGYTQYCRPSILAHRPAPIQVNYLGYPGTMGAEFIDYIIGDKMVSPLNQQPYYTEKIIHLPHCFQANDSKRKIADLAPARAEAGLPEEGFVFCCFNKHSKITPSIFEIWMRLLERVERSVIWLLSGSDLTVTNLHGAAQARGIDRSRLVFAPRVERYEDHLARLRLADLFLDTLPYNAHSTASDSLWVGLPILTCCGRAFAGRVAASLLHAVGLPELATQTLEEYEALAQRLASDPALLQSIRRKLEENRLTHPLFNTVLFRKHIEAAYRKMWKLWQHGEEPQSFSVHE